MKTCPICGYRFETVAAYDNHVPCPHEGDERPPILVEDTPETLALAEEAERGYDPDKILADPNSLMIHRMYAAINIGIRDRGEVWAKCANCGQPYQLTEEWSDATVCSRRCFKRFRAYVENPEAL